MRGWLIAIVLSSGLAGCYSPFVSNGAPCSVDTDCPDPEACVVGHCFAGSAATAGPDAPGAGSGSGDRDGDGVIDAVDNCPEVANADQHNEDGDGFGDACDVCPQIKDNTATTDADTDHDGIGALCDPDPAVADTVWIFDGFHGLPAWSRSDNWLAVTGDQVQMTAGGDTTSPDEFLTAPIANTTVPDNFRASTTLTITAFNGSAGDHEAGIEIIDAQDTQPIDCFLEQDLPPDMTGQSLGLSDNSKPGTNNALNKFKDYTFALNQTYLLVLERHGSTYTCTVTGPDGTSASVSGTSMRVPRAADMVDIGGFGTTAKFGSLEVVGPPLGP